MKIEGLKVFVQWGFSRPLSLGEHGGPVPDSLVGTRTMWAPGGSKKKKEAQIPPFSGVEIWGKAAISIPPNETKLFEPEENGDRTKFHK